MGPTLSQFSDHPLRSSLLAHLNVQISCKLMCIFGIFLDVTWVQKLSKRDLFLVQADDLLALGWQVMRQVELCAEVVLLAQNYLLRRTENVEPIVLVKFGLQATWHNLDVFCGGVANAYFDIVTVELLPGWRLFDHFLGGVFPAWDVMNYLLAYHLNSDVVLPSPSDSIL